MKKGLISKILSSYNLTNQLMLYLGVNEMELFLNSYVCQIN